MAEKSCKTCRHWRPPRHGGNEGLCVVQRPPTWRTPGFGCRRWAPLVQLGEAIALPDALAAVDAQLAAAEARRDATAKREAERTGDLVPPESFIRSTMPKPRDEENER